MILRLRCLILYLTYILKPSYLTADKCSTKNHIVRTYEEIEQGNQLKQISESIRNTSSFYRTMLIDGKSNQIIVGAKDYVYFLDDRTLKVVHTMHWKSREQDYQACITQGRQHKRNCGNYIQFLKRYKNRLLICGSNSLNPRYKIINPTSYETIKDTEAISFDICSSPDPNYKVVGEITTSGELIAGTYKETGGRQSDLSGSFLMERPEVFRTRLTINANKFPLKKPKFIKSFHIGDSIYIFFMEDATELKGERKATVARACQTDNGGPPVIVTEMWTTLRKGRLNCIYKIEEEEIDFQYMEDVTYDNQTKTFYTTFVISRSKKIASAVCMYTLDDIEDTMTSNFLVEDRNSWKEIGNGNFLHGCKVNPDSIDKKKKNKINSTSPGKEPTDLLNLDFLSLGLQHSLMARPIETKFKEFQFMRVGQMFNKIVSMDIAAEDIKSNITATVLYIATADGRIITISKTDKTICVLEELSTLVNDPRTFTLNKEKDLLYVSSDETVIVLKPYNCQQYTTKSDCVNAHNPICGWSTTYGQCIAWKEVNNNDTWIQDLSVCPTRKGYMSKWSDWKPVHQQNRTKSYCLYRYRHCESSNQTWCDEKTIEIKNCTVNDIKNVSLWMNYGSVDGGWSKWSNWSKCHKSRCGNNTVSRERYCNAPPPKNGGRTCLGDSFQCRSCNPAEDMCKTVWSSWSKWGKCEKKSDSVFEQNRTRTCSRKDKCTGISHETRKCAPEGIIWGNWSKCNCVQNVKHRFPLFITGCSDCPAMKIAYYAICEDNECESKTDSNAIEKFNHTNPNADENQIGAHNKNIHNEKLKDTQNGFHFSLKEVIIICCGIFVTCFLVCTLVIVLVLKHKQKKLVLPGTQSNKEVMLKQTMNKDYFDGNLSSPGRSNSQKIKLIPSEATDQSVPLVEWNGTKPV